MNDIEGVNYLLLGIGALAACVSALFWLLNDLHKQCISREAKCDAEYKALLERVVKVETLKEVNISGIKDLLDRALSRPLAPAADDKQRAA